jgi:hypothetical protein
VTANRKGHGASLTIIDHVRRTAKVLSSGYDRYESASKLGTGKALFLPDEVPRLDPSVIDAIAAMIEAEGDEKIGQHLAKVAARLQILNARMKGLADPAESMLILLPNLEARLSDCTVIHA